MQNVKFWDTFHKINADEIYHVKLAKTVVAKLVNFHSSEFY